MADTVIGKRPYHAFLSHAHVNRAQADSLYDFLVRVAGIPVWYDAVDLPPGASFARGLYEAIEKSRSAIILLSHDSVASGWVEQEHQAAQNQHALGAAGNPARRGRRRLVLADITGDSPNVYIEAGAALSAGVPVALLRAGPQGRPPFMLRDQQVYDYATDAELVGRAIQVAYPYRRFLQT